MPEGDTIHRSAARLRPVLEGCTITRFEAPRLVGDRPKVGDRIEAVEARGKHLLIHLERGLTLRTHMRMTGSWHIYRTGERWQKAPHLARATIEVDSGWVAVCFAAPVVETYHRGLGEPAPLASLGPDLCRDGADIDAAVERMEAIAADQEIGSALLDQRIACGIGNIYKSETLFACGIDPFATVTELDKATRLRLIEAASRLLRANLGAGPRATHAGGVAVYGRRGQPCPRCGTPVQMRRQGEHARSTYWCPTCQPSRHPLST
jgi:endonuclease-8